MNSPKILTYKTTILNPMTKLSDVIIKTVVSTVLKSVTVHMTSRYPHRNRKPLKTAEYEGSSALSPYISDHNKKTTLCTIDPDYGNSS